MEPTPHGRLRLSLDLQVSPAVGTDGTQVTRASVPRLPQWVEDLADLPIRSVTARFDGVRDMDILTFQQRVVEAYQSVFHELEAQLPSHPVRFWAFIPGIHDDLGAGLDRYMAFNAGRYSAFAAHFGKPAAFDRSVPTASAVGVHGDQFVLYALAAGAPGRPIENPRQVSAYHYSRRFGPMPPCFARATMIEAPDRDAALIVAGTASIIGEESRHIGELPQQAYETFRNLASVVASAGGTNLPEHAPVEQVRSLLADFTDIRVYHPRESDRGAIEALVKDAFPSSCRIELMPAFLCRPELLIEIEGLALPRRRPAVAAFRSPAES
jgi:chorismate lyase/3-hydroxybenzoate synthase